MNGGQIGTGKAEDGNTFAGQNDQLTVQSTMNLKKGDRVWLEIYWQTTVYNSQTTSLYDDGGHFTHFTGFMLEEEIVASL